MLNEEDRALGKATQEAPEAMGRLKQKALEAGLGLKDYVLWLADKEQPQEAAAKKNDAVEALQAQISELAAEVRGLRLQAQQPPQVIQQPAPQPQGNPFGQISQFVDAMTSLSRYNQTIVEGYKQVRVEALSEVAAEAAEPLIEAEGAEPMSVEDKILLKLFEKGTSGAARQAQPAPKNFYSAPAEPPKVRGGNMELSEAQIKDILAKLPAEAKQTIKQGKMDYAAFNAEIEARGFGMVAAVSRRRLYDAIMNEGGDLNVPELQDGIKGDRSADNQGDTGGNPPE